MFNPDLLTHAIVTEGFYVIEQFLEPKHCDALRHLAKELEQNNQFKHAKIGSKHQTQQNTTIRSDKICWLDSHSNQTAVQLYLEKTKQIAQLFNQTLYLGLTDFECHFAIYQTGTYYKKHLDQFAGTSNRKISCVYYLNEDWQEDFGGELKLYNPKDELIQTIYPQNNRFICFNSELPHEVCATQQTRYSITGWMKTRAMSLIDSI